MTTYHNCSKGYLWGKGFAPFILSLFATAIAYIVYFFVNQYVVHNTGPLIILVWTVSVTYLWYRWYRHVSLQTDKEVTWAHGWVGEHAVRKALQDLPGNWHVFDDVRLEAWRGNIDFVLVSTAGVYAVEVKTWSYRVYSLYGLRYVYEAWIQTHNEGKRLYRALASLHPRWVQTVLIFANQDTYTPRDNHGVHILGVKEIEHYFTHEALVSSQKLTDKEVEKIVHTLEQLAGCGTHAWH